MWSGGKSCSVRVVGTGVRFANFGMESSRQENFGMEFPLQGLNSPGGMLEPRLRPSAHPSLPRIIVERLGSLQGGKKVFDPSPHRLVQKSKRKLNDPFLLILLQISKLYLRSRLKY